MRHNNDVELQWPNKQLSLRAAGANSYEWIHPQDSRLQGKPFIELLGSQSPLTHEENILVAGDGLDAVEALASEELFGKGARLVYIDPPFNTGKVFNQYGDNLASPMWLSMMRDRLSAIRPILGEGASVWLHLDDSELHHARCIMDEVFGEKAYVASIVWQKRTTRESRSAFSNNHDTILVYAPEGPKKWKQRRNLLVKNSSKLINRDNDPRGPWTDAPFTAPGYRSGQQYKIVTPSGKVLTPPRGRSWYATEPTYKHLLEDDRIWFPKDGAGAPRLKLFPNQIRGLVPFTVWLSSDVGTTDSAKKHLLKLFPDKPVFDTPKPEELLESIIHIATDPGELVVDLFCGSGTTAAVAQKMHRRWIVAERNYATICGCVIPRLEKVINGDDDGGVTEKVAWRGGGGYRVVRVPPRLGRKPSASKLDDAIKKSCVMI
ncbi:site-specific DNA-methyltransferase [Eggerthella guodeyinii]|uniref:Site-specific DNA-methyltransferase n=2 Tax=Eggerthella guodeyinii TaxID=2690837 RepID=A0A6L7ITI5_9ACTN|nr:site-specific DNA-methyltransferase [Eggerthella guodeyinii]